MIMHSNAVRIGGLAAMLGGALLVVYAVGAASMPRGCIGNEECAIRPYRDAGVFESLLPLALLLIVVGMAGLAVRARQSGRLGRLGGGGATVGALGVALLVAGGLVQTILFGGDFPLMPYFVIPGFLALISGLLILGGAVLRARVLPRWSSVLIIASTLTMLGFNDQNVQVLLTIPFALAWVAAGYILWSGGRDAARRPEPAS
jgi:hypothetical protein